MSLEIQTGTPTVEGRYVVFTPCAARQIREWCEPHIATWSKGAWVFFDPICGWIGPLPVVKVPRENPQWTPEQLAKMREYDL